MVRKYIAKAKEQYNKLGAGGTMRWLGKAVARRTVGLKAPSRSWGAGNLSDKKIDLETMFLKNGTSVFIFSMVPYYDIGGGQRPAQMAKVFNQMGLTVGYVHGMHTQENHVHKIEVPTIVHKITDEYSPIDFAKNIRRGDIVIFEFPYYKFIPYLYVAKECGAKIIYESIDNWETSLGNDLFEETALKMMLRQ